jgi:hypothetical protein
MQHNNIASEKTAIYREKCQLEQKMANKKEKY